MKSKTTLFFILTIMLSACDRMFVDDLTEAGVTLSAPENNHVFNSPDVELKWKTVDDADYYNLIVVSPTFSSQPGIVFDSNLHSTSFSTALTPGDYEWCVSAKNYYSTAYSDTFSFRVDSNGSILSSKPAIVKPTSVYSNSKTVHFEWRKTSSAERYLFEIRKGDWKQHQVLTSAYETGTAVSTSLDEGVYSWGVQSVYKNLYSGYNYQSLIVDTTAPDKPELSLPANESTVQNANVEFSWKNDDAGFAEVFDSIFISKTNTFENIVVKKRSENNTTTIKLDNNTYFWKIVSYDNAGNVSVDSDVFRLNIQ